MVGVGYYITVGCDDRDDVVGVAGYETFPIGFVVVYQYLADKVGHSVFPDRGDGGFGLFGAEASADAFGRFDEEILVEITVFREQGGDPVFRRDLQVKESRVAQL